jgi:2-hydroxychromene-2-carboxylate isomerase
MRGTTAAEFDSILPRYLATAALDALGCDGARDPRPHARPAVDDRLLRNSEQSVGGMVPSVPRPSSSITIYFGKDRLRDVEDAIRAT